MLIGNLQIPFDFIILMGQFRIMRFTFLYIMFIFAEFLIFPKYGPFVRRNYNSCKNYDYCNNQIKDTIAYQLVFFNAAYDF